MNAYTYTIKCYILTRAENCGGALSPNLSIGGRGRIGDMQALKYTSVWILKCTASLYPIMRGHAHHLYMLQLIRT